MLEQVFVGTGILAWLSVLKNDADGALVSLDAFRDRAEEEAPNLISNIDAFICRIKLYQGEDVSDWMKQAPDENAEFCTMERFRYLTKVRVYISLGKLEAAYCLLQQLLHYAEIMKRTYIHMEAMILLSIVQYKLEQNSKNRRCSITGIRRRAERMKKKIIAATLALTLSMSMGNFVYAAEDSSADIKATYQAGKENTDTVYSVDVKWGSLEYTYSSGVTKSWDPTTLKYKETSGTSSWTCQDGADQITVTNNSNADITASLAYGKTDNNITGTFTNSKIGLKSAEGTNVGESPSETTTLSLKGALSDTTAEKKEIGNVTVTISDYVGTSSNYKWDGNGNISWGFLKTTLTDGVYTVEKECPGNNYLASIFYIYNKGNSQEKYVIKDGDIKAEGTYSLQKVTSGNGSYGVSLPSTMALNGKTIRLTVDLRNENNPTLTVKVI